MRTPEPRSRGVKRFTSAFFGLACTLFFFLMTFLKTRFGNSFGNSTPLGQKVVKVKVLTKMEHQTLFFKHQTFIPRCIKSVESVKSSLTRLDIVCRMWRCRESKEKDPARGS